MLSHCAYPIICTDNFARTVAFYEDHFDYVPVLEQDHFVVMGRTDRSDILLAVMDNRHALIPESYRVPVRGMILNYPVSNACCAYQQFYWEGLNIVSEPGELPCGGKYFLIEDPNGILINVTETGEETARGKGRPACTRGEELVDA